MKLKSLLKPLLGAAALGTGAYYYKYGKLPFNISAEGNNSYTQGINVKSQDFERIGTKIFFDREENYEHEIYTNMLTDRGIIYEKLGQLVEAKKDWWAAYFIRIEQVGHDHPDTIESRKILIKKDPDFFELAKLYNEIADSHANSATLLRIPMSEHSLLEDSEPDVIGELNDFLHGEL